ncbi:MAG TPA: peptidoglycan glycosyltransferase, partial [Bacteroidia bacterium]|nr:peptidoglycan glycosyltransferase [Bacteroidia bacterium]
MSKNPYLENRKFIIGGIFSLIALIYISRLFYLQVIDDKSKLDARHNAFHFLTEFPVRGYIYDRNGKLLVFNDPAYDLMVVPKNVLFCDTQALCKILG